jgi:hypothetical protein
MPRRKHLPDERIAVTHRLTLQVSHEPDKPPVYWQYTVTLGYYTDGRLGEVFFRTEDDPAAPVYTALATSISLGLQYGVPFEEYQRNLLFQQAPAPRGKACDRRGWSTGVNSPLDMLAKFVGEHTKYRPPAAWKKRMEEDDDQRPKDE